MKKMNKKGFTLVELLAVIVILALIMGIAIVSMSGVLDSAKKSTMKETAASIIAGVRNQLVLNNKLAQGKYHFTSAMFEKGGVQSPFGGEYKYYAPTDNTGKIGTGVYACGDNACGTCSANTDSYVEIDYDAATGYSYKICLSDGTKFINMATEEQLLDSSSDIIQ